MGILLAPIALLLFSLIGIVHMFITIFYHIPRRAFFKTLSKTNYNFAYDVDVFGNYLFGSTWNRMFGDGTGYQFGVFGETISSAVGKKKKEGSLSFAGYILSYILDLLFVNDWLESWTPLIAFDFEDLIWIGHSKASIMSPEDIVKVKFRYVR